MIIARQCRDTCRRDAEMMAFQPAYHGRPNGATFFAMRNMFSRYRAVVMLISRGTDADSIIVLYVELSPRLLPGRSQRSNFYFDNATACPASFLPPFFEAPRAAERATARQAASSYTRPSSTPVIHAYAPHAEPGFGQMMRRNIGCILRASLRHINHRHASRLIHHSAMIEALLYRARIS